MYAETYGRNRIFNSCKTFSGFIDNFVDLSDHGTQEFGLKPLNVATWGPFVLLNLDKEILPQQEADNTVGSEWLGSCSEYLAANGVDSSLSYLCRRVYDIECNWKVIVLNLLFCLELSQGPFILFCLLVNHVVLHLFIVVGMDLMSSRLEPSLVEISGHHYCYLDFIDC